jgi:hypothetical protein
MTSLTVGIDVAKATFTAASWKGEAGQPLGSFPNTEAGMAALAQPSPPPHKPSEARASTS